MLRQLAAALLPVALLVASPVHAATIPALSTFDFSGQCTDCANIATAELVLSNYALGTAITTSNFVSFTYNQTNLLGAFSIPASNVDFVAGAIGPMLPGPQDFFVSGNGETFESVQSTGAWCAGPSCLSDYGPSHTWSLASTPVGVPEPMTVTLLGAGLFGLAALRRKPT